MQFDVNVLGFVKLIDLLTPNMELSNLDCGARIVTIANKFGIMPTIVKNTQKNTKDKKNKTPDSGEWMIPTPTKREYGMYIYAVISNCAICVLIFLLLRRVYIDCF